MNTSESFFGIHKQPNDFCNYIDPIITPYEKNLSLIDTIEDIYYENFDEKLESIDFSQIVIPNSDDDILISLINEMDAWALGWIKLFEKAVSKEEDKFFKLALDTELLFFRNRYDIFKMKTVFFFQEIVRLKSSIEISYKEIQEEIKKRNSGDNFVFIYSAISDYKNENIKIINLYNMLRETASELRTCVNDDLKVKSKIQLFRVKYSNEAIEFFKNKYVQVNGSSYNIKNYSFHTELISLNRNYL